MKCDVKSRGYLVIVHSIIKHVLVVLLCIFREIYLKLMKSFSIELIITCNNELQETYKYLFKVLC